MVVLGSECCMEKMAITAEGWWAVTTHAACLQESS